MKLFLVHAGFYDNDISDGFYESHTNYFVVANDVKHAKAKEKQITEYKNKKMHIDGIKEIDVVDGHKVLLREHNDHKNDESNNYSYDEVKKI